MDSCFNCGTKIEPDWQSCGSCGAALETAAHDGGTTVIAGSASPKVELISRGWDEVIETVELPADPLEGDDVAPEPLAPGAIEVSVDDITVVAAGEDEETAAEPAEEALPVDPWDHLRPHGELPPLQRNVSVAGRLGQAFVLLAAIGALASAGLHFYLNTRLDAFSRSQISAQAVDDVEMVADMSLFVLGGLIVVGAVALGVWMIRSRHVADFRPGKGGLVALLSFMGGIGVVAGSFAIRKDTITEAIAANSLIVLGLGLIMTACLATVRTVDRIDRKEPA